MPLNRKVLERALKKEAKSMGGTVRPTKDGLIEFQMDPRYWKFVPPSPGYPNGSYDLLDKPMRRNS